MNNISKQEEPVEKKKSFNIKDLMNLDIKDLKKILPKKLPKKPIKMKSFTNEKKKKVIAFDIGSSFIKLVVGMYYKGEVTVEKYITFNTPKGAVVDGEIKKEDELIFSISKVLNENQIKVKDAICTTNSTLIINRDILIPKVEEEEIDTVVRYEIQKYLPINLDDYIIQVVVLNEEEVGEDQKLNVRAIAYPEKIARGYYDLLSKLDLKAFALDINYNSVNKFINYTRESSKYENKAVKTVAYIDIGASSINVNIYVNEQLDFTRIIKSGGNDISEILRESMDIGFNEIEELKANSLDLFDNGDPTNITTKKIVDEWIEKIEKIIQFYKNRNIGNNVDGILIYGGSSKIKGLQKYMTQALNIDTRRVKGVCKISFKSDDDGEPIDDFINVIGSVIRF